MSQYIKYNKNDFNDILNRILLYPIINSNKDIHSNKEYQPIKELTFDIFYMETPVIFNNNIILDDVIETELKTPIEN
jgi:hypothetical protein